MSPQTVQPPNRTMLARAGIVFLAVAAAITAAGVASRTVHQTQLKRWTNDQAAPSVVLARLSQGSNGSALTLPGKVQPYTRAVIYARVSGYLKQWSADIGTQVKTGQVLGTIDTPDLDQQYEQAKADLATSEANEKLALLTAQRWHALLSSQSVAQQTVDEKEGDAAAKKAIVAASRANLGRLVALESFKTVTAPFDGMVTARKTDIGALITVGNNVGQELFEVSDLHRVRVYVQVPQAFSAQVQPGMQAYFSLPQYPGRRFPAVVATKSNALETGSASMLVELQADNPDHALAADAYAEVTFELPQEAAVVRVPATALMPADQGVEVAVLGRDNRVRMRPVRLGRDFGDEVEVLSGISAKDRVIDNPPETLEDGETVRLATTSATPSTNAGG